MSKINMVVMGKQLTFEPNITAYNKLLNETAKGKNISGAAEDYLKRIVTNDSKESLDDLLLIPAAAAQIAGKINDIYAPELEIEIKE